MGTTSRYRFAAADRLSSVGRLRILLPREATMAVEPQSDLNILGQSLQHGLGDFPRHLIFG
jgi:hypothetical protein